MQKDEDMKSTPFFQYKGDIAVAADFPTTWGCCLCCSDYKVQHKTSCYKYVDINEDKSGDK